jgi:hypothetical protein
MNGAGTSRWDHHWQGVQRLTSAGARHFAISRSFSDDDESTSSSSSKWLLETAKDCASARTGSGQTRDPPSLEDGIVLEHPRDQDFKHAGGIQLLGNILAVPVERGATIDLGRRPP